MTQTVLQWKFTACQYNIENANGFKTYSMSEGLTDDDKDDLIRFGGAYARPENSPDRPTPDELPLFPVSLISFQLRSGKRAVIRTCYVGKDYAGVRWGNFFSHGLILPSGTWDFYPIQLWNSEYFKSGLTEEEQNIARTPPPLPTLEIDKNLLYDWTSELNGFFAEKSRREIFRHFLSSVRILRQSGKNVLLRDQSDNLPLWIAATQYMFPVRWSQEVFFSTYVHSVTNARLLHIAGDVPGGNDISSSARFTVNSFLVYNLIDNKIPEPSSSPPWLNLIDYEAPNFPGSHMEGIKKEWMQWKGSIFDRSIENIDILYSNLLCEPPKWVSVLRINSCDKPTDPISLELNEALQYLRNQPLCCRLRMLTMITTQKLQKIDNIETLKTLLPILVDTYIEKQNKTYSEQILSYIITQFRISLSKEEYTVTGHYEVLKSLITSEPRKIFAERIWEYFKKHGHSDTLFLEFSLALLLSSDVPGELALFKDKLSPLKSSDAERFLLAVLPISIEFCVNPSIHKIMIDMFKDIDSKVAEEELSNEVPPIEFSPIEFSPIEVPPEKDVFKEYVSKLALFVKEHWKEGDSPLSQITAFMGYLLDKDMVSDDLFNRFNITDENREKILWGVFGLSITSDISKRREVYKALLRNMKKRPDKDGLKRLKIILELKSRNILKHLPTILLCVVLLLSCILGVVVLCLYLSDEYPFSPVQNTSENIPNELIPPESETPTGDSVPPEGTTINKNTTANAKTGK